MRFLDSLHEELESRWNFVSFNLDMTICHKVLYDSIEILLSVSRSLQSCYSLILILQLVVVQDELTYFLLSLRKIKV